MISLVLMQNTSKMLDHNVLVRKAEGIETAGSLNILFSDKTGTITKGSLEVVDFFTADGQSIELSQLEHHSAVNGLVDLGNWKKYTVYVRCNPQGDRWKCNRSGIDEVYRRRDFPCA